MLTYLLSFMTLAILLAVTFVPFSTKLLSAFITYRVALLEYWLNILALGVGLLAAWYYVERHGLIRSDAPPGLGRVLVRRIYIAQALYAFGMTLCLFNNYVAIGFIILLQINYVIAPRIGILARL